MSKLVSLFLLFSYLGNLHAAIPFSKNVTLGVNYSNFFSAFGPTQNPSAPYPYQLDFDNLQQCAYLNEGGNQAAIKLFNDHSLPEVFEKTNKEIFLGIDNVDIAQIASGNNNNEAALNWVAKNEKYMSRVKAINVGNEIFAAAQWDKTIYQNTPQAMRNIIAALKAKNLSHIKVTTTTCCATSLNPARDKEGIPGLPGFVIPTSYTGGYEPPFTVVKDEFKDKFKEILKIIAENDSFLSINLYPPFAMQNILNQFPLTSEQNKNIFNAALNAALFKVPNSSTGRFMVEDMIVGYDFAIKKLNNEDPSVPAFVDYVISEVGWPRHVYTPTDSNEYVSIEYSKQFLQGLKNWAKTYVRTLDKYIDPSQSYSQKLPIFIFSFRDEQYKPNMFEPYWGLYTDTISPKDETGLCTIKTPVRSFKVSPHGRNTPN